MADFLRSFFYVIFLIRKWLQFHHHFTKLIKWYNQIWLCGKDINQSGSKRGEKEKRIKGRRGEDWNQQANWTAEAQEDTKGLLCTHWITCFTTPKNLLPANGLFFSLSQMLIYDMLLTCFEVLNLIRIHMWYQNKCTCTKTMRCYQYATMHSCKMAENLCTKHHDNFLTIKLVRGATNTWTFTFLLSFFQLFVFFVP